MTSLSAFALGSGATALVLVSTIGLLWGPLGASLEELCGTGQRGNAWLAFCVVTLLAGAVMLGFSGWLWRRGGDRGLYFWNAVTMFQWSVAGLLLGLGVISVVVLVFTSRLNAPGPKES